VTFRERVERVLGADAGLAREHWGRLEALDALVVKWSKAVDLTGFRSEDVRVRRYFAESLAAVQHLPERGAALDIGSGGGSPALPLAVVRPEMTFSLVESNQRKAAFLEEAARSLGLNNVTVHAQRFEALLGAGLVDVVTVRGVAMVSGLRVAIRRHLRPDGQLFWFSSRERLSAAVSSFDGAEPRLERLVGGGGCLLVVRRAAL